MHPCSQPVPFGTRKMCVACGWVLAAKSQPTYLKAPGDGWVAAVGLGGLTLVVSPAGGAQPGGGSLTGGVVHPLASQ
jgi:hypothetical protein